MMIAVEGMDGVGKTEISKYISRSYGFDFVEKPLHFFYNDGPEEKYQDFMKAATKLYDINDATIKSWYFGLGNLYVANMFKDKDVVVDRHLVSNYYWNGSAESELVFKTLVNISCVPDLTILLYATPETRMKRLRKRDINDPDLNDPEKKDDGYDKMLNFLERYKLPYVVINTEDMTLDQVKAAVDFEIIKLRNKNKGLVRKNV